MSSHLAKQPQSRRAQIKKAGGVVFIVAAFASVIVVFCIISMKFLWEKKSYNDRVIGAKTKARDDITTNVESLSRLSEQFPQLESSASTNSKTILHALPPTYDYAALASSVDYLSTISGVTSDTSIGTDISASAAKNATTSSPVELPLTLQVKGNYESIRRYITNLERSIRPIHVKNVTYTGTNNTLTAGISAVTYYQPARSLDVEKKEVQ